MSMKVRKMTNWLSFNKVQNVSGGGLYSMLISMDINFVIL